MLKLENVTLGFSGKKVLNSLSYAFEESSVTAIIGESGIGKTTLLNILAGLLKPSDGEVIRTEDKISYVFQEPRLFPWMTALENVSTVSDDARAKEALELMGLLDSADKYPSELSGGMKQRVSIARAIAYDPHILFLDEPFKGLDPALRKDISETLFNAFKGRTVIMITHDTEDLKYADTVLKLETTDSQSFLTMVKSNI